MMYRYMIVNVSIIAESLYRDFIIITGNELWVTVIPSSIWEYV